MSRNEANNVTKVQQSHEKKYQSGEDRAQRVRNDGSGNNGIRVLSPYYLKDCKSHFVEEGDNLDLQFGQRGFILKMRRDFTISDPMAFPNLLPPPENTNWDTMVLM